MGLMANLVKRNGRFMVRVDIPADIRAQWGKTAEWRALNTTDKHEAIVLGAPIIAELKRRIEQMRSGASVTIAPVVNGPTRITPERATAAIDAWRQARINEALVLAYNGELDPLDDAARADLSNLIVSLEAGRELHAITGLNDLHAAALGVPADHPALKHSRPYFAESWSKAERQMIAYREGRFDPIYPDDMELAPQSLLAVATPTKAAIKLTDLLSKFKAAQNPAEVDDLNYAWRRLVEFVGDIDANAATPSLLEDWVLAVKKFPLVRKPEITKLPMKNDLERVGCMNDPKIDIMRMVAEGDPEYMQIDGTCDDDKDCGEQLEW